MLRFLSILLPFLLVFAGCSGPARSSASPIQAVQPEAGCKISLVDEEHHPDFQVHESALVDLSQEPNHCKAYFAMGCFWGSEAMLASAPGVVSTRVGFAGGSLPDPSYSAIGDHVETVEVVYDPSQINYEELLTHFWKNHNARAKPIFRQYASAIFCEDDKDLARAKSGREKWQATTGEEKVLTAVLPLQTFYPAGETHQKYYLQQDEVLLKSLPQQDLNTLLATKLNAVSGRAGERATLEETLGELGISKEAQGVLFRRALWPST